MKYVLYLHWIVFFFLLLLVGFFFGTGGSRLYALNLPLPEFRNRQIFCLVHCASETSMSAWIHVHMAGLVHGWYYCNICNGNCTYKSHMIDSEAGLALHKIFNFPQTILILSKLGNGIVKRQFVICANMH